MHHCLNANYTAMRTMASVVLVGSTNSAAAGLPASTTRLNDCSWTTPRRHLNVFYQLHCVHEKTV